MHLAVLFQLGDIQFLWHLLALWSSYRLNAQVEFADNKLVICTIVCTHFEAPTLVISVITTVISGISTVISVGFGDLGLSCDPAPHLCRLALILDDSAFIYLKKKKKKNGSWHGKNS